MDRAVLRLLTLEFEQELRFGKSILRHLCVLQRIKNKLSNKFAGLILSK